MTHSRRSLFLMPEKSHFFFEQNRKLVMTKSSASFPEVRQRSAAIYAEQIPNETVNFFLCSESTVYEIGSSYASSSEKFEEDF